MGATKYLNFFHLNRFKHGYKAHAASRRIKARKYPRYFRVSRFTIHRHRDTRHRMCRNNRTILTGGVVEADARIATFL